MSIETNSNAICATGLSKRFGKVQAVSNIDLIVAPGEAVGLLGPNGAGKSTTLSMLMGLQRPDAGQTTIFGHPAGSVAARAICGAPRNPQTFQISFLRVKYCPIQPCAIARPS